MALKRLVLAAAVSFLTVPAFAQDYGPYGMSGGGGYGFDWDGFYSGVYGGGTVSDPAAWNGGIFTGVNVALDSILIGAEAQVGAEIEDGAFTLDALLLARGGMSLGDLAVYGTAGGGVAGGEMSYAVGAGVEYGVTDYLSVRGDALGLAEWGSGPDELRLTAGFAFHL